MLNNSVVDASEIKIFEFLNLSLSGLAYEIVIDVAILLHYFLDILKRMHFN